MSENMKPQNDIASMDSELRNAVRDVMERSDVKSNDLARVQTLVDRKAAHMRAQFSEKVRRIKESA